MPSYGIPALAAGLTAFALVPTTFAQAPLPGAYQQDDGPPRIESDQRPLFAVSSVELSQNGTLTTVRVRGIASTDGWQKPVLVPLVRGAPSDGVLDLVLVAEPPPEAMPATGFKTIEAVLLVEENHPYRAVRVRSASNVVALHALTGKAETPVSANDCHACIGHPIVASATDGIGRDSLPKGTRILLPTDPFGDVQPDPNRLTLLVGDDGNVIEAMWQ